MTTYRCTTCGTEFERHPNAMTRNKSGLVYCSRKCAAQRQQRALPDLVCPWCGKTFYRKPSERVLNNNYCSRKCANQAQSRTLANIPELRKAQGVAIPCSNCSNVFFVKPHRASKAKYCSCACAHAARFGVQRNTQIGKNIRGNRNPNFRGTNNRVTARDNAVKYFGNKCMVCGWNVTVDVHHIIPRRQHGTNNMDNLIVLCPNHHRLADIGQLDIETLKTTSRAAIAQLSDPLPQFDLLTPAERDIVQPMLLSVELEATNPLD